MSSDAEFWENYYLNTPPDALPWNLGGPDPDLVRLVSAGTIPVGQALDVGTGPGHDAIFLIHKGFDVIAIDISATAVTLARENASSAGVFGFFQVGDIREIPVENHFIHFINDRGCFHTLEVADRKKAVEEMSRVLKPKGLLLIRVFSDKEPGTDGPHRFTQKEFEETFKDRFRIVSFWKGQFDGPRKPKSYSMLLEKR